MPTKRAPRADCQQAVVKPHEQAIRELIASHPAMKRNGFWRDIEALAAEVGASITPRPFLPDAYLIDRAKSEIVMHEVVASNDIDPHKMATIADFWEDWDGEGETEWSPRLIVHYVNGLSREINLAEAAFA